MPRTTVGKIAWLPRTRVGWIVGGGIFAASAIILVVLADSWGELITIVLSYMAGFLVGSFLMLGAYRFSGWGESAASSVATWSFVGGIAFLFLLATVLPGVSQRGPAPNLEPVAFWTGFGVIFGIIVRARAIRDQLRTETTETESRP
jgi:hypothetical protein